jgi:hypothetical protein
MDTATTLWAVSDEHGRELTRIPAVDEQDAAITARRTMPGVAELDRFTVLPAEGDAPTEPRITDQGDRLALRVLAGKLRGPGAAMHVDAVLQLDITRHSLARLERDGLITWHHLPGANPEQSSLYRVSLTQRGLRAAFCVHHDVCHRLRWVRPATKGRAALAVDTPYCSGHAKDQAREQGPRGD